MPKLTTADRLALSIWRSNQHEAVLTGTLAQAVGESARLASALVKASGALAKVFQPAQAPTTFQEQSHSSTEGTLAGRTDIVFKLGKRLVIIEAKAKPVTAAEARKLGNQLRDYASSLKAHGKNQESNVDEALLQAIRTSEGIPLKIALIGGYDGHLPPKKNFGNGIHILTWDRVRRLLERHPQPGAPACLRTLLAEPTVALRLGTLVDVTPFRLSRYLREAFFDETVKRTLPSIVIKKLNCHWDKKRKIASPWTESEPGWKHSGATSRWVHSKEHPLRLNLIRSISAEGDTEARWVWSFPLEVSLMSKELRGSPAARKALPELGAWKGTQSGKALLWVTEVGEGIREGQCDLNLCSANVERAVQTGKSPLPGRAELLAICDPLSKDRLVSEFWSIVSEMII